MSRTLVTALALVLVGACEQPQSSEVAAGGRTESQHGAMAERDQLDPALEAQIEALRARTAALASLDAAAAAGWDARLTECFASEAGGMGFHYGRLGLFDDKVEASEPEILLFAPIGGKLRFVAVEYAVPFTAWTKPEAPTLYGQSFHRNEQFQLWVLHVWHERKNPRGIFADWNPTVDCGQAAAAD